MISDDLILMELEGVRRVVQKWIEKTEAGIPGVTAPCTGDRDVSLGKWTKEFWSEMLVCSSKCETLARVIAEQ